MSVFLLALWLAMLSGCVMPIGEKPAVESSEEKEISELLNHLEEIDQLDKGLNGQLTLEELANFSLD